MGTEQEWEKDKELHVVVPKPMLEWIDKGIKTGRWRTRAEVIRLALWELMQKEQ